MGGALNYEAATTSLPVDATKKGSDDVMKEIVTKSDKASSTSLPVQDPSKGSLGASKESTKKSWQVSSPLSLRGNKSERTGADVVKSLRFVIFPDNKWIKKWDLIVLAGLFLLIFILPYQIGVSGGITLLQRFLWFVFNVLLNSIFFVDTFLYFFRAYYTRSGHLVLDLKKIRRRYLRTYFIPNILSVLPFTIAFYVVGTAYLNSDGGQKRTEQSFLIFVQIASCLKLIRLVRVRTILSSSDIVTDWRQRRNSQVLQLWKYVWLIVVVSHWFACIWSFVAFIESDGISVERMLSSPNWIAFWYENNAVENGGLYPLGLDHAIDRYVLSLFWAIQTITSIGYGNIVPVTRAEYFVACSLQLCAGVMWAYVIGGLVGVAAGMHVRAETYRSRTDQANEMIQEFADPDDEIYAGGDERFNANDSKHVAKRIRKYIHKQYTRSKGESYKNRLSNFFPVFDTLSPELQRDASVLILNQYLEAVSYLSSKYMSHSLQSLIAMQSTLLEFSSGELIRTEKDDVDGLGRGIFIFKSGCAFNLNPFKDKKSGKMLDQLGLIIAGMAYGAGRVLLGDDNPAANGRLQFLTFSQVVFIPRKAILDALKKSEGAWKECARWIYLKTLLIAKLTEDDKASSV